MFLRKEAAPHPVPRTSSRSLVDEGVVAGSGFVRSSNMESVFSARKRG